MYTVGVLSEIDDFESPDDIVDALGAILLESHEEATEEVVNELCGDLFKAMKGYVFVVEWNIAYHTVCSDFQK